MHSSHAITTLSGLTQASIDKMASFYIPWSHTSRMCPAVPYTRSHLPRVHDAQLSWDVALPSCSEDAMGTTRDADQPAASEISQVSILPSHTRNHGLHSGPAETWRWPLPWPKQPVLPGPWWGRALQLCHPTLSALAAAPSEGPRGHRVSSGPGLDAAPGWASPGTPHAWGPPSTPA